jgi:hypothetical protein
MLKVEELNGVKGRCPSSFAFAHLAARASLRLVLLLSVICAVDLLQDGL